MQPTTIQMVQNDAAPSRTFTFTRADGTAVDLTTAVSVTFDIYLPGTHTQTNATVNTCLIQTPKTNGQVIYLWNTTDLPMAGVYNCKLVINWPNGLVESALVNIQVEEDPAVD